MILVFFKKIKKSLIVLLLTLFIMPTGIAAYSDYIMAGGDNIGIELNSKGIMVVGVYKIGDEYPALESNIHVGDIITNINDKPVSDIKDMVSEINKYYGYESIKVNFIRNYEKMFTNLKLFIENNTLKTGIYVKDSINGIGTLTFIDPNTKIFGALGHEIIESSTGQILDIKGGKIYESTVTGILKSKDGTPGEKNARYFSDKIQGKVKENTNRGVFGTYTNELPNKKLYKVAESSDIIVGEAKILTVVETNQVEEFTINITRVSSDRQKTKNILFEITDSELLETTGGIIQGMSGSPIIQGEYIIGAVTHVIIDKPTKGYGIFITNMLEEAEN
jgi:stage IV sporulation protein B